MVLGEGLVDIATLVSAIFGDFPFVPDFNVTFLQPADVVASGLINPEEFKDGSLPADFLGGKNREFFCKIELEDLVR